MQYQDWSPFENRTYARHEANVIITNSSTILSLLTSLNLAWLLLPVILPVQRLRAGRWTEGARSCGRALVVPLLLGLVYVPFFVSLAEQRYFYAAYPFLFAAPICWVKQGEVLPLRLTPLLGIIRWAAILGAAIPLAAAAYMVGASPRIAGDCASDLARRLRHAGISGPIAGSAMLPGGRTGLYVAFLLNQPWYGDERNPAPADLKAAGARLVLVNRGSELADALGRDSTFRNLDPLLFAGAAPGGQCPVQVFELSKQD